MENLLFLCGVADQSVVVQVGGLPAQSDNALLNCEFRAIGGVRPTNYVQSFGDRSIVDGIKVLSDPAVANSAIGVRHNIGDQSVLRNFYFDSCHYQVNPGLAPSENVLGGDGSFIRAHPSQNRVIDPDSANAGFCTGPIAIRIDGGTIAETIKDSIGTGQDVSVWQIYHKGAQAILVSKADGEAGAFFNGGPPSTDA